MIFDPLNIHCCSAAASLGTHRGEHVVVTTSEIDDVYSRIVPSIELQFDLAILRIPCVISVGQDTFRPRSCRASHRLEIVKAVEHAHINFMVCTTPWAFWFYEIGTDLPADELTLLGRSIDQQTNVFEGCYIAPDWRQYFDMCADHFY